MESVNLRYNGIWKLLNDYNFNSIKRFYPDLICVICNKLLRNAHQNECGCRYCLECIQLYCQNNDKPCPGKTEECNEKIIDLSNDIQEDFAANKKLSMITVTCPILNCQFTDCLIDIENHIQTHQVDCPYNEIGCEFNKDIIQNVNAHLNQDSFAHSKLIIRSIFELKLNMLPTIEKLHKNHAEELNEYFFSSFKAQEDKIANLQSENEKFKKQLESIFNQSQIKSISNDLSSVVTEDHSQSSKPQNELEKNVTTTITLSNTSNAHLETINRSDNLQILLNDFSIFKFCTNNELTNQKEIQKKINSDIKSLQTLCKSHSNSTSNSNSHSCSLRNLEKYLNDCHYEIDRMQIVRRKSEKANDEMKKFNEKFQVNNDSIREKVKRIQRDICRIERTCSIENIEKFNKVLKDYFSDSEKLHEKFVVYEDELELSKRDNEKIHIKCHTNHKGLSTVKESLGNFDIKFVKISNELKKIKEKLIGIEQNYRELNTKKSIKKSDSESSFEKIIDLEAYKIVIDDLQINQKNILEMNEIDSNSTTKINQKEIMDYLEKCQFNNKKEMEENVNQINENIILIKRILNDFQLENNSIKNTHRNIEEEQLKINNRLIEIDNTLHKNSIDNENINDFINKTVKEINEMKNTTENYQNDTNSIQMDFRESSEKLFSTLEILKEEMERFLSNQNKLQNENIKFNQDLNRIKSELQTNSTDIENINFFFVDYERRFENIKNDIAVNYEKIEILKNNNADSWENVKRISIDLEKLSKDLILLHKFNEDLRKIDKEKVVEESRQFENYVNKLKEENVNMEIQNKNNFKIFRKSVSCNLKESKGNIEKFTDQMQILQRKSDQSRDELNEALALQNSKIEQISHVSSNIQSLEKDQSELNKKFDTISKMFRNLKTECLNRRSEIISPVLAKKAKTYREWLIGSFQSTFKDAQDGETPYITSELFTFVDYNVRFKLFPNGDNSAKDKYLSIFCFIQKKIENFPQRKLKLVISLVNRLNVALSITNEYEYCNFIKQESSINSKSYELGTSNFISLDNLFSTFIENDSILFRYSISSLNSD